MNEHPPEIEALLQEADEIIARMEAGLGTFEDEARLAALRKAWFRYSNYRWQDDMQHFRQELLAEIAGKQREGQ